MARTPLSVSTCGYIMTEYGVNSFFLGETGIVSGVGIVFYEGLGLVSVEVNLSVVADVSTIWIMVTVGCDCINDGSYFKYGLCTFMIR